MWWILLAACSSEPEEIQIVDKKRQIAQRSIIQLLQVDPLLMQNAWSESMTQYSGPVCPVMEEHNGMDLWRQSCTTDAGNQFLGWALRESPS